MTENHGNILDFERMLDDSSIRQMYLSDALSVEIDC